MHPLHHPHYTYVFNSFYVSLKTSLSRVQSDVTELTRFSFGRTDQWASRASPTPLGGAYCDTRLLAYQSVSSSKTKPRQFSPIQSHRCEHILTGVYIQLKTSQSV